MYLTPGAASTLGERLLQHGISRRSFLKFCSILASSMALPAAIAPRMALALSNARPCVIYMSFQECTGCLESLLNSHGVAIENLILDAISLDYQETLQAAAGHQSEQWRDEVIAANYGKYILIVDGSIPQDGNSGYFVSAAESGLARLNKTAAGAAFIVAVGTCASFGGIAHAYPNPTGAVGVRDIVKDRPIINVSGCPPIAEVITGVLAYYLTFQKLPTLDSLGRPTVYYGKTVHDDCYREESYEDGPRAKSFDDSFARNGNCLFNLGCKGPVTHNACSTLRWNQGTSFPIQSGHGCIGCSEPDFWDAGGLYVRGPEADAEHDD